MRGNLDAEYLRRVDRIRRIEDAFQRKTITGHERTRLLQQEGFGYIDSSFRPIGEAAHRLVEKLKCKS